jgi:hypothetical protein
MPAANIKSKFDGGNLIFTDRSGIDLLKLDAVNHRLALRPGSATGAGLSPNIWSDCPRLEMLIDPTLGWFVGDDFTLANGESYTTAKNYVLAGANGAFTHVASAPHGEALVNAAGADNDESNVSLNTGVGVVSMTATSNWWFETRLKINQITTAQGVFAGLVGDQITVGVDFHTDNTMAMKVQDTIGFQIIHAADEAAIWQTAMHHTGGARVAANATALTASTGYVKLGMKMVNGTVTWYINGTADATTKATTAANFPHDVYMIPMWATKCGTGVQNTITLDWWYVAQLR